METGLYDFILSHEQSVSECYLRFLFVVRAFHRYDKCMKPIRTRCNRGLQQILDYESSLRRYALKMSFICSDEVLDGMITNIFSGFLRASAMLKHVIAIGLTSVCPSVCPSVRPSHAGIVSKRLNILSCFLRHTIAHSF